jgi:hypothetical protein
MGERRLEKMMDVGATLYAVLCTPSTQQGARHASHNVRTDVAVVTRSLSRTTASHEVETDSVATTKPGASLSSSACRGALTHVQMQTNRQQSAYGGVIFVHAAQKLRAEVVTVPHAKLRGAPV